MAVKSRLEAVLRAFSASNARFARDKASSKWIGGVGHTRNKI